MNGLFSRGRPGPSRRQISPRSAPDQPQISPRSAIDDLGAATTYWRYPERGATRSEAILADLLNEYLLHAFDVVDLLSLYVPPHILQGRLALGVGDILVVAPQGVETLAQIVNQVVVVICHATSLSDVLQFLFRR